MIYFFNDRFVEMCKHLGLKIAGKKVALIEAIFKHFKEKRISRIIPFKVLPT